MTTGFYDALAIRRSSCPPGCYACMDACARRSGDNAGAVLSIIHKPKARYNEVAICAQCNNPGCLAICPVGAITKSDNDGVVRIDDKKCVGCRLCTIACLYGGVYFNKEQRKASKCDACVGKPKCVEACPYGVLSFVKSNPTYNRLQEDIMPSENNLCPGCSVDLAFRFMCRIIGMKDVILYSAPGCLLPEMDALAKAPMGGSGLMTTVPSTMTGASRYFRKTGKDATLVAFVGDGTTADIGFQGLSAAAERGEQFIYMCYDNEAYQNTGIQRSSTTPYGAWTMTTQVGVKGSGKTRPAKNVPLLMAMHGIAYTATVSISHLEDFARKVEKARAAVKHGLVYIHILIPCPTGWRAQPEVSIELARLAVETNYFPLWESESGKFRFTFLPKTVKPVKEFTMLQGRFDHLTKMQMDNLQKIVNDKYALIEGLTRIGR